jgi:hypothetical protein
LILVGDGRYAAGQLAPDCIRCAFEKTREYLRVERQRQWSDRAIVRSTPILMGLYSCICLMAKKLAKEDFLKVVKTSWHPKKKFNSKTGLSVVFCRFLELLI